ncbi:MAG TPA: hypothetical protein VK915_13560 [Gaiellaceae bacterium]|nr:hypothetical protein [Gaiellaceae bacterium]
MFTVAVDEFPEARGPAWKLEIDFGPRGVRRSSAQLTHCAREELLGRQVVCVLGFEPKEIHGFESEVLVLGALSGEHGVVLLRPDPRRRAGLAGRVAQGEEPATVCYRAPVSTSVFSRRSSSTM